MVKKRHRPRNDAKLISFRDMTYTRRLPVLFFDADIVSDL